LLKTKAVIEVMAFVFKEYGYVTSLRNSIFTSLRRNPFISIAYGNKPGYALFIYVSCSIFSTSPFYDLLPEIKRGLYF